MANTKEKRKGYEKLLDYWVAPENAGAPIGCLVTSFTFSPVFFEEECLARFLSLESNPNEDGPVYLVEREEKLSQVACATALVDQHHCKGSRSLRWDMLPVMVRGGVSHAKMSLLYWKECIRVIIGSANLTEDGYRRNHEIFGVLDFKQGSEIARATLTDIVSFLRKVISQNVQTEAGVSPPIKRAEEFLDRVLSVPDDWFAGNKTNRKQVRVSTIVSGEGYPDVLEKLLDVWPASTPPASAYVISPFFDLNTVNNHPAEKLWSILRKRGHVTVSFYVTAEDLMDEDGVFLYAPESLLSAQPTNRSSIDTEFYRLELDDGRPLHVKSVWLEDDRWALYLVGSSNFTSAGLGLSKMPNLEANLVYVVDKNSNLKACQLMRKSLISGKKINLKEGVQWKPRLNDEDEPSSDIILLPSSFGFAIYDHDADKQPVITLTFIGTPPKGWTLLADNGKLIYFDEDSWKERGCPKKISLTWTDNMPPSGFHVKWIDSEGAAWWPVNIAATASLPPPAELKDLPLDVLIHVLTSARPLYRALEGYLKRRNGGNGGERLVIDPHTKVDTSKFLLQRTRRVSAALNALRERIERPVATEDGLHWRLTGPVGVLALKDAMLKECSSDEEKAFLLTELILELSRVKLRKDPGCVSQEKIRLELKKIMDEIKAQIPIEKLNNLYNLKTYINSVFSAVQ